MLPLGSDVASPPVCRFLSVSAPCRSILPVESPSSFSRRECGAGVRPPPESGLSLRTGLSLLQLACAGAPVGRRVPVSGLGHPAVKVALSLALSPAAAAAAAASGGGRSPAPLDVHSSTRDSDRHPPLLLNRRPARRP